MSAYRWCFHPNLKWSFYNNYQIVTLNDKAIGRGSIYKHLGPLHSLFSLSAKKKKIKSVIDYGDILYMHANVSLNMLGSADHAV